MQTKGHHKILLEGKTMRPGRASQLVSFDCQDARNHFIKAKRMRTWDIVISQFGIAEFIVGAFAIDRGQMVFGVANAAVGGVFMTMASNRSARIQHEVDEGVKAYNRCILWK